MTTLVITTGGTIGAMPYYDPIHPPRSCVLPPHQRDMVKEVVKAAFCAISTRFISLPLKDSCEIDDAYRQLILDTIIAEPEDHILITHGTDSILQTATYLYNRKEEVAALRDKTIILTGAMVPLANGLVSDGFANLDFALQKLSAANDEIKGLYIVLCDFDAEGVWRPRLYPFEPDKYQKVYAPDGRYNRLFERP